MNKLLVVIDVQNDFVTGSLGSKQAELVVPAIIEKVRQANEQKIDIVFTRDTHEANYLETEEGKQLPVKHCIRGTKGWELIEPLKKFAKVVFDKPTFGSLKLGEYAKEKKYDSVEVIGLYTDICVVVNVLLLKTYLWETPILVDATCCAGLTEESHQAAIETMKMCQVQVDMQ